jgi:hypothetical protein
MRAGGQAPWLHCAAQQHTCHVTWLHRWLHSQPQQQQQQQQPVSLLQTNNSSRSGSRSSQPPSDERRSSRHNEQMASPSNASSLARQILQPHCRTQQLALKHQQQQQRQQQLVGVVTLRCVLRVRMLSLLLLLPGRLRSPPAP